MNIFAKLFRRKPKPVLRIVEGWRGNYHYHLSWDGEVSLCGNKEIMERHIRLSSWGFKSEHIPMTYCKECERLHNEGVETADRLNAMQGLHR